MSMGTAQRAGAIEIDVQPATIILRDEALWAAAIGGTANTMSLGAVLRGGYHINPKLALGAGLGFGSLSDGVSVLQILAGATYTLNPDAQMSPFVTLQGVQTRLTGGPSDATGNGVEVGAGLRRFMSDNLAIRLDGRVGISNFSGEEINAIVGAAGVGVAYYMGGGPPPDTDADGVPDRRDGCANTPRGATVDARGCPSDTDRDGVWNGLDACPDTPANTPVDARGCTRDSDRDGIADNTDACPNTPAGTQVDARGCPRDADGDGVVDSADRCANTPRGTPVDATGCPRDSDGDGVLDPADTCPSTPAGTPVDARGCPRDSDGDGVWDNRDNCTNTAPGTQVDANGCPVARDADSDGVIDANDRCPATPAGRRVDANGCPLYELPAANASVVMRGITFAGTITRPTLTANARQVLDQVATAVQSTPNSRWEIGAYWDNRGVAATITRRTNAQAQAVVAYLVSKGLTASQLTAVGYGSRNPVRPNTTLAGRNANRRVEIKRLQ